MFYLLAIFVAVLCVWVHWLWQRRQLLACTTHTHFALQSLTAKIPQYSHSLPLIGHASLYLNRNNDSFTILKLLSDRANECGGITTLWFYSKPHFAITDPKYATIVLNTCLEKNYIYDFFKPWLGNGLFTGNVKTWSMHRRIINPCFNSKVLDGFQITFNRKARKLVNRLKDKAGKGPCLIFDEISLTTFETVSATVLGFDEEEVIDEEIVNLYNEIQYIIGGKIFAPWTHFNTLFNMSSIKKKQDDIIKRLQNFSRQIVTERILKDNVSVVSDMKFKPFYELIHDMANTKSFPVAEIRDEVDTMILGSHDTSVLTLMYAFILLGSHIHVQDKVYAEINEVFQGTDRDVTKDDLHKLVYTEAVINETLRIYPVGPFVGRTIDKNVNIGKYTLPAGSVSIILFWGMHRASLWGSDAHEFKPDRWLVANEYAASFGGFSMGRRSCLGKNYAMMSLKTKFVHMLRHYRFRADATQLKFKVDIMLRPKSGHHICLEARI